MGVDKKSGKKVSTANKDVKRQMEELGNLLKGPNYQSEEEGENDVLLDNGKIKRRKSSGKKRGSTLGERRESNVSSKSSSSDDSPFVLPKEITHQQPDDNLSGLNKIEAKPEGRKSEVEIKFITEPVRAPSNAALAYPLKFGGASTPSSINISVVNLLEQEVASIPIINAKKGYKQIQKENDAFDLEEKKEEIRKYEERRKRLLPAIREDKSSGFIQPPEYVAVLKVSMRFIPGVNIAPNVYGNYYDSPYLFKEPGRVVLLRIESVDKLMKRGLAGEEISAATVPKVQKEYKPAFGLSWPTEKNFLLQKSHQNMLAAFLNYYTKRAEAEEAGYSGTTLYDPNLSISCAISCGKSPFPKYLSQGFTLEEAEINIPYTPIPIPDLIRHSILSRKSVKNFTPVGFISKEEAAVSGNVTIIPENYIPIQVPLFPDLGMKDIGIPIGQKAGFMDSYGNFYEARAGDSVPVDASIGYLDTDGNYHQVLDVESGMQNGQVDFKEGFAARPSIVPVEQPSAEVEKTAEQLSGEQQALEGGKEGEQAQELAAKSGMFIPGLLAREPRPSEFGPGLKLPHFDLFNSARKIPGDVSAHQSQAVFKGVGGRKAYRTDQNHERERRKSRKKKKRSGRQYYIDKDGEEEEEEEEDGQRKLSEGDEDEDEEYSDEYDDYDYSDEYGGEYDEEYEGEEIEELGWEEIDGQQQQPVASTTPRMTRRQLLSQQRLGQLPSVGAKIELPKPHTGETPLQQQPQQLASQPGELPSIPLQSSPSAVTTRIQTQPWTGEDLFKVAPKGENVSVGYLDKAGEFIKVQKGEKVPAHVKPVYKDMATNYVAEITPEPKPPLILEVTKTGYQDSAGTFVEVKQGEGVPQGVVLGVLNDDGNFQKKTPPKLVYKKPNGEFKQLESGEKAPEGMKIGFVDQDGQFRPRPSKVGYKDNSGEFIELKTNELPPAGVTVGYVDNTGEFNEETKIPQEAVIGYVDKGVFKKLSNSEEPPPGVAIGFKVVGTETNEEEFIPLQDPAAGFFDSAGTFQQAKPEVKKEKKIPPGASVGYFDEKEKFHELKPGQKVPRGTPIGYKNNEGKFVKVTDGGGRKEPQPVTTRISKPTQYIENPHEIVEVEIHDENELDEEGKPKVKVVLRHRGSVAAPKDAKEVEGGGKVWVEGDEEVTELPYVDEHDLDEKGQPKVKKMRVRKKIDEGPTIVPKKRTGRPSRRPGPPRPGEPDYEGFYADEEEHLRDAPLTKEERERLIEFQKNITVQCELDFIEGSLDLGDVIRRSFRIYSHGGSLDVEPAITREEVQQTPEQHEMGTATSQPYLEGHVEKNGEQIEANKPKNQEERKLSTPKKPYPGPQPHKE